MFDVVESVLDIPATGTPKVHPVNTSSTIGEAARMTGLPPRTIRFYEQAGLLPAATRSASGYRLYSGEDLRRLRLVSRARILGLPLTQVKTLADAAFEQSCGSFEQRLGGVIEERLADIDRTLAELLALRTELEAVRDGLDPSRSAEQDCRTDSCNHCRFIDD
jgi:DNA-binding transcriptional MerR regulator